MPRHLLLADSGTAGDAASHGPPEPRLALGIVAPAALLVGVRGSPMTPPPLPPAPRPGRSPQCVMRRVPDLLFEAMRHYAAVMAGFSLIAVTRPLQVCCSGWDWRVAFMSCCAAGLSVGRKGACPLRRRTRAPPHRFRYASERPLHRRRRWSPSPALRRRRS